MVTAGVVATVVTTSATADCGGAAASGELGWALVLSDTAAVLVGAVVGAVASAVVRGAAVLSWVAKRGAVCSAARGAACAVTADVAASAR